MIVKKIPSLTVEDIDRFWSKVAITANDNLCWDWQGGRDKNGYGRIKIKNGRRTLKAHRVSYFINKKVNPKKLLVLHSCDRTSCCNPKHLFLGTALDNRIDCFSKGRAVINALKGEDSPNAKLTKQKAISIISEYFNDGIKQDELSKKYNVTNQSISALIRRKTWKHIIVPSNINMVVNPIYKTRDVINSNKDSIIKEKIDGKASCSDLAKKYNLSVATIHRLVRPFNNLQKETA